jgi:hypothetical protein
MTPEERQLIGDLFERMRSTGLPEKDREAEAFINQAVRATPDSAYKLVQSVLVQEHALQEAGQRMEDLEARVRELEDMVAQYQQPQQRQASSGGFLGGLFGSRSQPEPAPARQSVPAFGQQRGGYAPQAGYGQQGGSPWGGGQQQQPMQGGFGQQQPQRAGGGFMKSAMTTAAGVAGGMLAANMIKDMMGGGNSAHASEKSASESSAAAEPSGYEVNQNDTHYQDPNDNDPGNTDTGWDSGDSGDSGDMDI